VAFVITVPGADDVMLGYRSLSFHDVLVARRTLGLRPAPEFEYWLRTVGMVDDAGYLTAFDVRRSPLRSLTSAEAL
jgi:ethanolamine ammonia-lyase large subunit